MPRIIYLQLGLRDRVTLAQLIDALKNLLGVLRDLDSAISKDARGTIIWEVAFLEKKSPPTIGLVGRPRQEVLEDISGTVESEFINGVTLLYNSVERGANYSDSALAKIQRLAKQSKKLGDLRVFTKEGHDDQSAVIGESTFNHIEQLIGPKYVSIGSVLGSLDSITVHRANEFRVWDENTGKPVTCFFSKDMEDKVKSLLRSRVLVRGTVSANNLGSPISVQAETIEPVTPQESLPSIEEMSGLVDDLTEGKSLADYLKDIENG